MDIKQLRDRQMRLRHQVSSMIIELALDDGSNGIDYTADIRREMMDTRRKYMQVCEQILIYEKQLKQDNQTEMEHEL
mgnify:CR=1 FL=1